MRSRLTLSLILIAALAASACSRKKTPERIAAGGPETWIVDDTPYQIASTHYERGPGNSVVYVMTYPGPTGTSESTVDKDGAGILVWPLVKYAYNNRTFTRAQIPPLSGTTPPTVTMAIDLLSAQGGRFLFRYEVPPGK